MESSILVEIRNSDGCNLCFIEYLFIYYAELDLYSLVIAHAIVQQPFAYFPSKHAKFHQFEQFYGF